VYLENGFDHDHVTLVVGDQLLAEQFDVSTRYQIGLARKFVEDGVKGTSEVRPAVADQEPDVLEPLAETEGQVAGSCTVHSPVGFAVTPPRCIGRVPCSGCSCRISSRPACGARPAASLASRGRSRPGACGE
jgi:hypothetical protein